MSGAPQMFPAFLKLAGRSVVVVGGGRVAAAKLEALLDAGARVTVVAPEVRPELVRAGVAVKRREFVPPMRSRSVRRSHLPTLGS